ncbi:MAG: DUF4093 domain-containing protein [Clostridiales bacterium]|nr:DUF4093 domain-containing protein [Clostridiales bacterium]
MIKLTQCVIVEGKYDKQKLSRILDATILATNGFRIFKDREKRRLIQTLAAQNGIIILTDSDSAGFQIRNHIKSFVPAEQITNVYIPEIAGKEKRKTEASKEGLLGVEGIPDEIIIAALAQAGITPEQKTQTGSKITKLDLYQDGFSGKPNSTAYRKRLLQYLNLPHYMTANSILEIINATMSAEGYHRMVKNILTQDVPTTHTVTPQKDLNAEPYETKTGGNFSFPDEK